MPKRALQRAAWRLLLLAASVSLASGAGAQASMAVGADGLPAWVKDAGARREPTATRVFSVNTFGAVADGVTSSTAGIQTAIDAAFRAGGGTVTFQPGGYVTGAIFLKSNVHLRIDRGVTLLGSQDDAEYPSLWTRVAGIEMKWPSALINVNDQENVKISGGGTIDGRGQKWWDKYWSMRREIYEPRGLRWAADYDAERVRLLVVWRSKDVTVKQLDLRRSGFWTVQVVYSDHVTVDGISIAANTGPSTDGVDIDSSSWVLVQNTDIDNNDDNICLKSGRDWDGQRVGRPTEYVVIRNNIARKGGGVIAFGSETSGDIRHVVAYDNRGIGTNEGVRFKSAKTRGGVVEDVLVRGLKLENVPLPFTFTYNWNPSYSYATLPDSMEHVPDHWVVMNTPLPPDRAIPTFRNVTIENVEVTGAKRIFTAAGLPEKSLSNFRWRNITASGAESGAIDYARNWTMQNVVLHTPAGEPVKVTNSAQVAAPRVAKQ
jgi:polygalacturonase